jgi:hypothetical protein
MDLITRIKIWAGSCAAAASNEDLKATVERSKQVLWVAQQGSELSKNLKNAATVFKNANEGLDKVGETLDKVQGVCLDVKALGAIQEAITVLNRDGVIQNDPEAAAQAFGKLFGGFGRLAHHLPPPASAYASILEGCGGDFFNSMRKKINPEERWKAQFKQVEGF